MNSLDKMEDYDHLKQERDELAALVEVMRDALQFYADSSHFTVHQDVWESVSGEPENFLEDENNTATVEDGSIARVALSIAPIPPADVQELQQRAQFWVDRCGTLEARIAELERKLAEQQSQNNFDATRLRCLASKCGVSVPESDEELLGVAGVVLGTIRRVVDGLYSGLAKALEEGRKEAVPDALRKEIATMRTSLIRWRGDNWPGTNQVKVVDTSFPLISAMLAAAPTPGVKP